LEEDFSELKPGGRALLIYNGHGLQDQNDSAENTLRLWNDTKLQDFILSHPHYPELVTKQDRRAALEYEEISNLDRDITQLDKILRLRNLARLQSQFARHATEEERGWYQRLQSCEGQPL
jgi:hypothetical protein